MQSQQDVGPIFPLDRENCQPKLTC